MSGSISRPTRRAWPVAAFVVLAATLALVAGCSPEAKAGNPALPPGFTANGIPNVDLQAYAYVNTGSTVDIPAAALGEQGAALGDLKITGLEGVVNSPSQEYAARVQFEDSATASQVAQVAKASATGSQWVEANGSYVMMGRQGSDTWTSNLQTAWTNDQRTSIEQQYPDVWSTIQLLPDNPPAPPIAAGFVRNVPQVAQDLMNSANVQVPGLSSALDLMRVETAAVVVYGNNIDQLPQNPDAQALKDDNLGVLAVANAGYPGFVINFLFPRFTDQAGLQTTDVDGSPVYYRALDGGLNLMVKDYGSAFYFAIAPSKQGAADIIRSVMKSQASR